MIKNYLKAALRSIKRAKMYSVLNILGLAVGMGCCFLIFLFVQHELSYDRFHEKYDRIYRVAVKWELEGEAQTGQTTPAPVAPALLKDFPEVEEAVRLENQGAIIRYQGASFVERKLLMVDTSFFEVFHFPLIKGNPETALSDIHSVVLTERAAEKYFGGDEPLGKILNIGEKFDFEVTGVAQDPPSNSHIDFDFLVKFDFINNYTNFNYMESWGAWNFHTYVVLQEDYPPSAFEEKSPAFLSTYRGDAENPKGLHLNPLTSINLETHGKMKYIYFFTAVAVIILILACINFMNLSIARSSERIKEIGMRKVIGASKPQLIKQFLGESAVLAFLALPLALLLVLFILPSFNSLASTQLESDYLQNWLFILGMFGITAGVGVISGSYPSFYLSSIHPVKSLKGKIRSGAKSSLTRSLLVVFQFSVSIALIVSAVTVSHQIHFIHNKDLGFDPDSIVNVPIYESTLRKKSDVIKSELLQNPDISKAAVSTFSPGSHPNQSVDWEGRNPDQDLMMAWYSVDYDFVDTFGIEIQEGRDFSRDFPSDVKSAYILNEAAVRALGWDQAVGKQFAVERADTSMGRVVGVMKDFHFASLHQSIRPLALILEPSAGYYFSLKISSRNMENTLSFIENTFKAFAPNAPFNYRFTDEEVAGMYMEEDRLGTLVNAFSVIALFIACLGLLGLASSAINRRTKEIGVRKVLGASIPDIFVLLVKDFTKLVLIANIIAWPAAYYAMSRWLQNFVYRIGVEWWLFAVSALAALIVSIVTVSYHTTKAAVSNPVDSLRYE
jgi:putative ABC transport system permease protein